MTAMQILDWEHLFRRRTVETTTRTQPRLTNNAMFDDRTRESDFQYSWNKIPRSIQDSTANRIRKNTGSSSRLSVTVRQEVPRLNYGRGLTQLEYQNENENNRRENIVKKEPGRNFVPV